MFESRKVVAMIAYFLNKQGGSLHRIKIMKLLYLSEREYLLEYGNTMTMDKLVSMAKGPVLVNTRELMKNAVSSGVRNANPRLSRYDTNVNLGDFFDMDSEGNFALYGEGKDDIDILLKYGLSKADSAVLDKVWERVGGLSKDELVDYTHAKENCPEWSEPSSEGDSTPIKYEDIFESGDYSASEARDASEFIFEQQELKEHFAGV